MYLYTDQIEFAPYGLKEKRKSGGAGMEFSSPKSMYRLADKVLPIVHRYYHCDRRLTFSRV